MLTGAVLERELGFPGFLAVCGRLGAGRVLPVLAETGLELCLAKSILSPKASFRRLSLDTPEWFLVTLMLKFPFELSRLPIIPFFFL